MVDLQPEELWETYMKNVLEKIIEIVSVKDILEYI